MFKRFLRGVVAQLVVPVAVWIAGMSAAAAQEAPPETVPTVVAAGDWARYRAAYIEPNGRVVDVEKNGVSHSEGQGYGLLLAVLADDRETFDSVLAFSLEHMRKRSDDLFNWLYIPTTQSVMADSNNASDGDVLIGFALILAAVRWDDPAYMEIADPLVTDIGGLLLERRGEVVVLLPGALGFTDRDSNGPVVNLSYYIYGAFPLFASVDADHPWLEVWQSGLQLTEAAASGPYGAIPDWATLMPDNYLAPADGVGTRSSYDAVRIPLYMALGGRVPARHFAPFDQAWNVDGSGMPLDRDLATGATLEPLRDPGYRAVAALAACAARGVPMPVELTAYRNTTYFASTLHLLALGAARWQYPGCADGPVVAQLPVYGG